MTCDRRRVLYASFDEVPSFKGASTHILAFAGALAQSYEVELVTLGERPLPRSPGFVHRPLALDEPHPLRRGAAFRAAVAQRLATCAFDVFHFRTPWEGLAALDSDVVAVYELNGLPSVEMSYHYPSMTERTRTILAGWEERCLRRADLVVTPSPTTRAFVEEHYGTQLAAKVVVIPNGAFPVPDELQARDSRLLPDGRLPLVYLGTLARWQGLAGAIRALRPLAEHFRLDVYGSGQERHGAALRRRLAKWGLDDTVRLCGPLASYEIARTLPRYAVGLCPLIATARNVEQGCCPVKILDYRAHGLWTLAADLPVTRVAVTPGRDAVLYPAGSVGALREALAHIAAEKARYAVPLANNFQFTWSAAGEALHAAYGATLARSLRFTEQFVL